MCIFDVDWNAVWQVIHLSVCVLHGGCLGQWGYADVPTVAEG
jgi:hypothetical protein